MNLKLSEMKKITLLLISLLLVLLNSCVSKPSQVTIIDTINAKGEINKISADQYGFYTSKTNKIKYLTDFRRCELMIIGETEPSSDTDIVKLGVDESGQFLCKAIKIYKTSSNVSCPQDPCIETEKTLKIDRYNIGILMMTITYSDKVKMKDIIKTIMEEEKDGFIIFMKKTNSKGFGGKLVELKVK